MSFSSFLQNNNLSEYEAHQLPSDCSPRKYYRIYTKEMKYILMDSSAEKSSVQPFSDVANILNDVGIVSPIIYAHNFDLGYMLLEDFGDDLFSSYIRQNPQDLESFYIAAIDVIIKICNSDINHNIPIYSYELLDKELHVFVDWFLKKQLPEDIVQEAVDELMEIFANLYTRLSLLPSVLVLRDYHADNLMIVRDKMPDPGSLGVLDFQDAVLGNPAYDIVSFLQDARVDVSDNLANRCIEHFLTYTDYDKDVFMECYHILGLQRNLKIVGIFHRKNLRDGSSLYLDFLPRVWLYIEKSLNELNYEPLKNWFKKYNITSYV
ncbi:MAG: aminoglycoside phosphotransferase family protein [Alphaproteobacteria bacterium]